MYSQVVGAALAVLGLASAAPSMEIRENFPRTVTQHFRLRANNTGVAGIDGVLVGTRLVPDTFIGFNLPHGQQPRVFGYDPNSAYVYAGVDAQGQQLILGAHVPEPNTTASIRPSVKGEKGFNPLECTILAKVLFCNVNIGPTLYHDIVSNDYNNDGHYELAMATSSADGTVTSLVVEPV